MTLRLSHIALVAALALAVSACNTEPQAPGQGTVAVNLLDADGTITLNGLDSDTSEHITLKAGESRIARLPAGLYSVDFTPDIADESGAASLGTGPELIVVVAERVTTLEVDSDFSDDGTPMASIEVW